MSALPCSPAQTCPGSDSPVLNLSSETADEFVFIGVQWKPNTPPPVNKIFTNNGCIGICTSTISQDDADQCAARQAALCVIQCTGPDCTPPCSGPDCQQPPPPFVCSNPASCTIQCPDGLPFTFNVPAGLFCGDSQTQVDEQAHQYACKLAPLFRVCIAPFQKCLCVGSSFQAEIVVVSPSPVTISLVGGAFPPGLSLVRNSSAVSGYLITGTPTTPGPYNAVIQAITSDGLFMVKGIQFIVLQITTTSLPAFTPGVPYDFTLQVVGGSGQYAWKIDSGTLPNGIVMETNGRIHGTPL